MKFNFKTSSNCNNLLKVLIPIVETHKLENIWHSFWSDWYGSSFSDLRRHWHEMPLRTSFCQWRWFDPFRDTDIVTQQKSSTNSIFKALKKITIFFLHHHHHLLLLFLFLLFLLLRLLFLFLLLLFFCCGFFAT